MMVVLTQLYSFVKIHLKIHIVKVHFTEYKLHFNKTDFKRGAEKEDVSYATFWVKKKKEKIKNIGFHFLM